jgi:uncharacterized protein (TIGR02996 family)
MSTNMTDTQRQLLRAIITTPEDDVARLAYADYIEEHGDEKRAEFIRLQIKISQSLRSASGDEWNALWRRERELLFAREPRGINNGILWLPFRPLTAHMKAESDCSVAVGLRTKNTLDSEMRYTRGFITRITCSAADWLAHADKLVWYPEMTDVGKAYCYRCGGTKSHLKAGCHDYNREYETCRVCKEDGKARIPRPMPDSAQPIERATLTSWPNISVPGIDAEDWACMCLDVAAEILCKELSTRYKGVDFEIMPRPLA